MLNIFSHLSLCDTPSNCSNAFFSQPQQSKFIKQFHDPVAQKKFGPMTPHFYLHFSLYFGSENGWAFQSLSVMWGFQFFLSLGVQIVEQLLGHSHIYMRVFLVLQSPLSQSQAVPPPPGCRKHPNPDALGPFGQKFEVKPPKKFKTTLFW